MRNISRPTRRAVAYRLKPSRLEYQPQSSLGRIKTQREKQNALRPIRTQKNRMKDRRCDLRCLEVVRFAVIGHAGGSGFDKPEQSPSRFLSSRSNKTTFAVNPSYQTAPTKPVIRNRPTSNRSHQAALTKPVTTVGIQHFSPIMLGMYCK